MATEPPRARAQRASSRPPWAWTTGSACASDRSAATSWPRRSRGGPGSSRRSCAPTGCSSSPPGSRATTPGRRWTSRSCAASGDRPDDPRRRLTRPRPRPRGVRDPGRRSRGSDARLVERRLARRARRAARRAVPRRRLPSAGPRHRGVPLPYIDRVLPGRERRGRAARPSRAGSSGRTGQPARHRRDRGSRASRVRYVNRQRGAGTRVLLDHELGRRGHRGGGDLPATPARSTRIWRSRPRWRRGAWTPAWGAWRRPARSGWTSCRSPASPTTSCSTPASLGDPVLAPLWALLDDPSFRTAVEDLGGYGTEEMGRQIRIELQRREQPEQLGDDRRALRRRSRVTRPIVCATSGSTSGIARRSAGSGLASSQVWAVMPGQPGARVGDQRRDGVRLDRRVRARARRRERAVDDPAVLHVGRQQAERQRRRLAPSVTRSRRTAPSAGVDEQVALAPQRQRVDAARAARCRGRSAPRRARRARARGRSGARSSTAAARASAGGARGSAR